MGARGRGPLHGRVVAGLANVEDLSQVCGEKAPLGRGTVVLFKEFVQLACLLVEEGHPQGGRG